MKTYAIAFFSMVLFIQCTQKKEIHITEYSQKNSKKTILVDVRTPEEYQAGHLDNAVNINWFDNDFADKVGEIAARRTIYVYCKKGGRSAKASHLLDSLGYEVVDLKGGYDAYIEASQP